MKQTIYKLLLLAMLMTSMFAVTAHAAEYGLIRTTLLNQDPDPAEPGKYVELRWKVEKLGSQKIENVKFELKPSYPFSLDPGTSATQEAGNFFGSSDTDEFYILYYKVRVADDALKDTYEIALQTQVNNEPLSESTFDVRVGEKQIPTFVIGKMVTSPRKLVADTQEAELQVDIENIGDGSAENVRVEMLLPDGFTPSFAYSEIDNLGTIAGGSSKTATFYLDIADNLPGGAYEAILQIKYKDENDDDNEYKTIEVPLQIPLKDKPVFAVTSVDVTPETIRPGTTATVKLGLKNVGGEDAETVSIRAFKESTQPFDFDEKSDYIGNIAAGETGEAVLQLTIDKDAPAKEYNIEIETRAVDGDEVIIQEEAFTLQVAPAQGGFIAFITSPVAIVVVIGLIGFGIYRVMTKKKH